MIEEINYQNICKLELLSEQSFVNSSETSFWSDATKYASISKDEPFVEEVAYMMVTLHRTGA